MAAKYAKDQPASFKNKIENVAVVGATGTIGHHITEHLLKNGNFTVTALTRTDSKASEKMPDGLKVAPVDYENHSALVQALRGQDALVIAIRTQGWEIQAKIIDAAAEAKVSWILPNEFGPDLLARPDMGKDLPFSEKIKAAKAQIEELGVSSRMGLVCSYWYEMAMATPNSYGFDIANKKAILIDDGQTRISTTTWPQIGRAVATAFSLPILPQDENYQGPYLDMWRNRELYVQSFCVSQRDMFDSILRVTGDQESHWTVEHDSAEKRFAKGQELLQRGGMDAITGFLLTAYTRIFFKDGSGDYSNKLDNGKLNLPQEDLDEATLRAVQLVDEGYNYFARG